MTTGKMTLEEKIDEFVKRAREAAGTNLEAVILFGSAASEDYDPEFSNLNLFCVLRDRSCSHLSSPFRRLPTGGISKNNRLRCS